MSTPMNNVRLILILLLFCTQTMTVGYAVNYSNGEISHNLHNGVRSDCTLLDQETDNDETPVKKKTPLRPTADKTLRRVTDD